MSVRRLLFASSLLALLGGTALAAPAGDSLQAILQDYAALERAEDPNGAAQFTGVTDASQPAWPDVTPAAVDARYRTLLSIQKRLHALPDTGLQSEDALNRDLLAWRVDLEADGQRFDAERIPFTADEGFFLSTGETADTTAIHSEADAADWLRHLRGVPAFYDAEIANMRRGLQTGFTQPRLIAQKVAAATRAQADQPAGQDPLFGPINTMSGSIPAARRDAIRAEALDIMRTAVKPAQARVARFFAEEYVPQTRTSLGASDMPDGKSYYAWRVRGETTTDLTPDQVFALGDAEIRRIRAAMDEQIRASGFKGDFKAFLAFLRSDPRFYVTSREALMEKASRLAKRVDDQLPRFFGKLPRLSYGVREVPREIEDGYTSGRYNPGNPRQGIAGGLMINTSHLNQRPLYELPSLVAHEGAPGHHIQIALAQELSGLPQFRQQSDLTAFVEGWALYSEQLVSEMGLYPTPYEKFGLLSMEMWRACRLVMDVGLHWKNWTREQALGCLRDNTALSDKNIQNETDRYIAWPGQALGYKVGELRLIALRDRARKALGSRFDYRTFHDEVLDEGAMPLAVLERRVDGWIDAQAKADGARTPPAP